MTEKPPAIDQDGNLINPHNPDFITKVPWYLGNNSGPTLKHHNIQKHDHLLSLTEADEVINKKVEAQREARLSASKTVYRKGACKNCGAMTHKEKDCLERPRSSKKSAWKSGLDIAADEVVVKLEDYGKVSYAAKRDSYRGYDPEEYQEIIKRHEKLEEVRKEQYLKEKEQKIAEKAQRKAEKKVKKEAGDGDASPSSSDSDTSSASEGSDSEEKNGIEEDYRARDDMAVGFQNTHAPQGGLGGAGMRSTVRNLRIREDTPKYLRNLSLDSAFYDPKSRSMRSNPYPHLSADEVPYAGDNFVRYTGDAAKLAQEQILCWEMQARGEDIDVLTNPSQAEMLHKLVAEKKTRLLSEKKQELLEKYGVKEQKILDPRLKLGQTEAYLEYNKEGRVIGGRGVEIEKSSSRVRTKYEEDVYINNHTSVWGSYYNRVNSSWGYACCHSSLKNSYCTGEKGREANDAAYQGKVQDAMRRLNKQENKDKEKKEEIVRSVAREGEEKGTKRSFGSTGGEVTEEEMDKYRMRRTMAEDPMANYKDQEGI